MGVLRRAALAASLSSACVGPPPPPPNATSTPDPTTTTTAASSTAAEGPTTTAPPDGSTTSASAEDDSTSTTAVPVREEILQHSPQLACDRPLWCFDNGIDDPAGGPTFAQECFSTSLPTPLWLTQVDFVLQGLAPQLDEVHLEVYVRTDLGPQLLVGDLPLDPLTLALGPNSITLERPIEITEPGVCIGLAAPSGELAGALGVAVDESSTIPNWSYLRLGDTDTCSIPDWTDVMELMPVPTGNWCISATVQTAP